MACFGPATWGVFILLHSLQACSIAKEQLALRAAVPISSPCSKLTRNMSKLIPSEPLFFVLQTEGTLFPLEICSMYLVVLFVSFANLTPLILTWSQSKNTFNFFTGLSMGRFLRGLECSCKAVLWPQWKDLKHSDGSLRVCDIFWRSSTGQVRCFWLHRSKRLPVSEFAVPWLIITQSEHTVLLRTSSLPPSHRLTHAHTFSLRVWLCPFLNIMCCVCLDVFHDGQHFTCKLSAYQWPLTSQTCLCVAFSLYSVSGT